ncbi:MAG TPA: hypothetical protein GX694_08245 [Actinomycetales bacterium]|nr:hypothetical protein [Actinomycetales bacterium]
MTGDDTTGYDPRSALADVATAREAVADRLVTPWWYHPVLGALLAVLVLVNVIEVPTAVALPVILLCAVGFLLLGAAYKKITGMWVDLRNTGPRSRAWWAGYAVVVLVMVLVPVLFDVRLGLWAGVGVAVVVFAVTVLVGRKIDAELRAEIRSGAAPLPRSA